MSSEKTIVRSAESIEIENMSGISEGVSRQILLGPEQSMKHFFMRKFTMQPGCGMPYHTNEVEHQQYVLSGSADVKVGDTVHHVKTGDSVYIPAKIPHSYRVTSECAFEFICAVPNQPDETVIIEK